MESTELLITYKLGDLCDVFSLRTLREKKGWFTQRPLSFSIKFAKENK